MARSIREPPNNKGKWSRSTWSWHQRQDPFTFSIRAPTPRASISNENAKKQRVVYANLRIIQVNESWRWCQNHVERGVRFYDRIFADYNGVFHPKKRISKKVKIVYASCPTLIYEENLLKMPKRGGRWICAAGPGRAGSFLSKNREKWTCIKIKNT